MSVKNLRILLIISLAINIVSITFNLYSGTHQPPEPTDSEVVEIADYDKFWDIQAELFNPLTTYSPVNATGDVQSIQYNRGYMLIVLPYDEVTEDDKVVTLTQEILENSNPLYLGYAKATQDGQVQFENVLILNPVKSVYYVSGPGIDTPLYEVVEPPAQA